MNIVLQLRNATNADHQRLDEIPLLQKLSNHTLSISEYKCILQRFYCLHNLFEGLLTERQTEIAEFVPDLKLRMKAGGLADDLRELGEEPKLFDFALPKMTTLSELMGCLYVLEGSTLGRSRLRDSLVHSLPELKNLSNKFFSSYGSETGNKWKDFCSFLIAFSSSNDYDETLLTESAKKTFMSVRELFLIDVLKH